MTKHEIVQRPAASVREKGQYAVALSLVGVMLYVAGFPVFFLLFVGVLTYFVWKIFSSDSRSDVRRIFEFYLSANEILRDDYRKWYGFEIQETIAHGEKIVRAMPSSPPLVHFALGALYDRLNDHSSAVKHLSYISEETEAESGIVFPSNELRQYVRILRKIERSPAEAPQTSAAVRSLERLRKTRTRSLLEKNRAIIDIEKSTQDTDAPLELTPVEDQTQDVRAAGAYVTSVDNNVNANGKGEPRDNQNGEFSERKTISEVLHDIYDDKVQ